jgi:hypothetical protein
MLNKVKFLLLFITSCMFLNFANAGEEISMTLVSSYPHPAASRGYYVCIYQADRSSYRIQVVSDGTCNYSIDYNILTNTWK